MYYRHGEGRAFLAHERWQRTLITSLFYWNKKSLKKESPRNNDELFHKFLPSVTLFPPDNIVVTWPSAIFRQGVIGYRGTKWPVIAPFSSRHARCRRFIKSFAKFLYKWVKRSKNFGERLSHCVALAKPWRTGANRGQRQDSIILFAWGGRHFLGKEDV